MNAHRILVISLALLGCFVSQTHGDRPFVEQFLLSGKLNEGEVALHEKLKGNPNDDQMLFELGVLQFFQTVEHMGQSLYELGPVQSFTFGAIPFFRMPVPHNPAPKAVELEDVRKMLQRVIDDLDKTDQTFAQVKNADVKLPLHVFMIHLDIDKNGKATEQEALKPILERYLGGGRNLRNIDTSKVVIAFDRSDVEWLRGYCSLLRALCETILAYDHSLFWDTVAHRLFHRGIVKHDFLREEDKGENHWGDANYIIDLIAGIHNCRFAIKEPERLKRAHQHLLDTIGYSRNMWQLVNAETDNDREWIPSPKQSNPISEVQITQRMTETWGEFLDEAELLLTGQKLIPFWRGKDETRGVNLYKVFHQPSDIDVVLWVHGSGAVPFLEIGKCSSAETWREFQNVFRGDFIGFAVWFN